MILVTHHITVCLPVASYLIELEKGHIKHGGTIVELQERGLLKTIIQEEEEPFPESSEATVNEDEVDRSKDARSPVADPKNTDGKLVEVEHRAEGQVSLQTYVTYLRAAGIHWWVATILLQVILMLVQVGTQVSCCLILVFVYKADESFPGVPCQLGRSIPGRPSESHQIHVHHCHALQVPMG
jgi:hypothetical protein